MELNDFHPKTVYKADMSALGCSVPFILESKKITRATLDALRDAPHFSCDIETTALNPHHGEIRLIQCYIPKIKTVLVVDLWSGDELIGEFLQVLREKLADRNCAKVWHNALFDVSWLYIHLGVVSVENVDSMILSQLAKAGQFNGLQAAHKAKSNSLAFLVKEFDLPHDKDIDHKIWRVPGELPQYAIHYGARDAYYTYTIARYYRRLLGNTPAMRAEMGAIPVFAYMNATGLPANPDTIRERISQYEQKTLELERFLESKISLVPEASLQWYSDYYKNKGLPKKFNKPGSLDKSVRTEKFKPGSSQSVARWLYSIVDDSNFLLNSEGKITTGKAMLFILATAIAEKNPEASELLKILIYYRSIKGAASKFAKYLESYQPELGTIAVSYSVLASQGTGRSSSGKTKKTGDDGPKQHNGQNFSKHLPSHLKYGLPSTRSIVQARPGYVLIEFDAAASHLQIARWLSQDPSLIESNRLGIKIHYYTLAGIVKNATGIVITPQQAMDMIEGRLSAASLGLDIGQLKIWYKLGKTAIYSFLNYAGPATLQQSFFGLEILVDLEACRAYLEACALQYSGLRDWQDRQFEIASRRIRSLYSCEKYVGHFTQIQHKDGATTYHQARIKENVKQKFLDKIGSREDDDLGEIDVTEEYRAMASQTRGRDLYLKISEVVAPHWLRLEATMMKTALAKIFDIQLERPDLDFRVVNYSHDSYLIECHESCVEQVGPLGYACLNDTYKEWIPDYVPEGKWQDCILGQYWEKPFPAAD